MPTTWDVLSAALKDARLCTSGRSLRSRVLRSKYQKNRAAVRRLENDPEGLIFAFGALWRPKVEPFVLRYEIGSLWVAKEYEGQGHCKSVMLELLQKVPQGSELILITDQWPVMACADKFGFRPVIGQSTAEADDWTERFTLGERLPSTITGNVLPGPQIRDRYLFYRPA